MSPVSVIVYLLSIMFKAFWIALAERCSEMCQNTSEILDPGVITIIVHVLGIKFWHIVNGYSRWDYFVSSRN